MCPLNQSSQVHGFLSTKEMNNLYPMYSQDYLAKLARERVIEARQFGRVWMIHEDSFVQWLADKKLVDALRSERIQAQRQKELHHQIVRFTPEDSSTVFLPRYVSHISAVMNTAIFALMLLFIQIDGVRLISLPLNNELKLTPQDFQIDDNDLPILLSADNTTRLNRDLFNSDLAVTENDDGGRLLIGEEMSTDAILKLFSENIEVVTQESSFGYVHARAHDETVVPIVFISPQ